HVEQIRAAAVAELPQTRGDVETVAHDADVVDARTAQTFDSVEVKDVERRLLRPAPLSRPARVFSVEAERRFAQTREHLGLREAALRESRKHAHVDARARPLAFEKAGAGAEEVRLARTRDGRVR